MVINYEKALSCIEEITLPDKTTRFIFIKPIPTMSGMLCKQCKFCQICGGLTENTVICDGNPVLACLGCTDNCGVCMQAKVRHHFCCIQPWKV